MSCRFYEAGQPAAMTFCKQMPDPKKSHMVQTGLTQFTKDQLLQQCVTWGTTELGVLNKTSANTGLEIAGWSEFEDWEATNVICHFHVQYVVSSPVTCPSGNWYDYLVTLSLFLLSLLSLPWLIQLVNVSVWHKKMRSMIITLLTSLTSIHFTFQREASWPR